MMFPHSGVSSNFMLPVSELQVCSPCQLEHCQFSILFTTFFYRNPKTEPNCSTPFVCMFSTLGAHFLIHVLKSFICLYQSDPANALLVCCKFFLNQRSSFHICLQYFSLCIRWRIFLQCFRVYRSLFTLSHQSFIHSHSNNDIGYYKFPFYR